MQRRTMAAAMGWPGGSRRRRSRALLLGVAVSSLVLCGSLTVVGTAHAAEGWDRCPHGSFCLFKDRNGQGDILIHDPQRHGNSVNIELSGMNDAASAVWNRSKFAVLTYTHPDMTGGELRFRPYDVQNNLALVDQDKISSFKLTSP